MGVTIDKSRGSTVVEGVFIKSVAEGKSADMAQSTSGGLRPGMLLCSCMVRLHT